jgi:transcriptional regulator with XRE-family HTH domain
MATARYIDTELRSQIGLQLRGRLKEKKLSQEKAAELAGVHRTAFSRYVNGRATPRGEALARLCDVFDLNIQIGKKRLTAKDLKLPARETDAHYQYTLPFDQPLVFQVGGGALAFEITRKPAARQLELVIRFKNPVETSA